MNLEINKYLLERVLPVKLSFLLAILESMFSLSPEIFHYICICKS